ncbi:hypothetical protein D9758_006565 [Tetrapyrgos nigripes]|uniref:Uncharacterized protein n=1 Tax=Tetrapyrgos nigripes TaxID=182062 RepID=A0A8H5GKM4_9AGAR|nr:hypothetical protein D9758_006565 [Tetrapyrgos nigripes]
MSTMSSPVPGVANLSITSSPPKAHSVSEQDLEDPEPSPQNIAKCRNVDWILKHEPFSVYKFPEELMP